MRLDVILGKKSDRAARGNVVKVSVDGGVYIKKELGEVHKESAEIRVSNESIPLLTMVCLKAVE